MNNKQLGGNLYIFIIVGGVVLMLVVIAVLITISAGDILLQSRAFQVAPEVALPPIDDQGTIDFSGDGSEFMPPDQFGYPTSPDGGVVVYPDEVTGEEVLPPDEFNVPSDFDELNNDELGTPSEEFMPTSPEEQPVF